MEFKMRMNKLLAKLSALVLVVGLMSAPSASAYVNSQHLDTIAQVTQVGTYVATGIVGVLGLSLWAYIAPAAVTSHTVISTFLVLGVAAHQALGCLLGNSSFSICER
jgi:hypothetical protein